MKRNERKKIIPAVCVFLFVAFSFVIANTFGDTYAASCPSGYTEAPSGSTDTELICCPNGVSVYYSNGQCVSKYELDTSCPSKYAPHEDVIDEMECLAEPEIIKKTFTVILTAIGGQIKNGSTVTSSELVVSNVKTFVYSEYTAIKDGSTFIGWSDVSNECSSPKKTGQVELSGKLNLFACFEENALEPPQYTVTLKAEDAIIDDNIEAKEYNETHSVTGSTFNYANYEANKDGATFTGWGEKNCSVGTKTGTIDLTADLTLYACFTEDTGGDAEETSEFEISLDPGDGSWKDGTKAPKTATSVDGKVYLSSYTDDIVSPDGYIFNGWWSENEQKPLNSYADSKNKNETLTASFVIDDGGSTDNPPTSPTTYTVNFFDELGDELGTETVNDGETISDFPSFKYPKLEHFWSDSASCDSGYEFTENMAIVSDLELYQCYSEGFVVEFYNENREPLNEVEVFPVDEVIPSDKIPELNNGYDGFWSESKICESKFDVEEEVIIEHIKLYACYIYDIYFYGLDENEEYEKIGSSTFFNGYTLYDVENIPAEDDLLIDGKVFTHWSTSSNSCDENDMLEPEEILPLSLDGVNLYACYTNGEAILVRFNDMNSNKYAEIQVVKGTSINDTVESTGIKIPTAPTVEGYTFRFWSNGSNCSKGYNFDNKVEQPLTLTACYNKNDTSSGTTDDNVDNNPGTGSFMLYIVFLVGILSLGYTGYSVIKVTKKNS